MQAADFRPYGVPVDIRHHTVLAKPDGSPQLADLDRKPITYDDAKKAKVTLTNFSTENYESELAFTVAKMMEDAPKGTDGKHQILIFIHGGLNTKTNAVKRSAELATLKDLRDLYYPIFIDWESDFGSSWLEHLVFVRQGQRHTVGISRPKCT